MPPLMVIEYRVTYASGEQEFVTTSARNETSCLVRATAVKKYNRFTGKRDHVLTVEFWERRA